MALLRLPKIDQIGSKWERVRDSLWSTDRRSLAGRKPRRLLIDSLEERQLLSVSPVHVTDVQINQTTSASQIMLYAKSVATDHDGDFVAVWTRWDQVVDAGGRQVIDVTTGEPMIDANIYARYFTDAVQRVSLPTGTTSIKLQYNGNETQKLSITAGNQPFIGQQDPIVGEFSLWFDANGDGVQDANEITDPISFNESTVGISYRTSTVAAFDSTSTILNVKSFEPVMMNEEYEGREINTPFTVSIDGEQIRVLQTFGTTWLVERGVNGTTATAHAAVTPVVLVDQATLIQQALDRLGGALTGVKVRCVDANNYVIEFGDASGATAQPQLKAINSSFSGFLVAAEVAKVRVPGTTVTIPVSATNPAATAQNIEYAFAMTSQDYDSAPTFFPADSTIPPNGPYLSPVTMRAAAPTVSVTWLSATEFDITFTGNSAKEQQPLMVVLDAAGSPLAGASVEIIKQSSDEFRVNDPEPDDPDTIRPDVYSQALPQVAMGPDGDFVITWTSMVPDSVNPGSDADIFARRFSPTGYSTDPFLADMDQDGVAETAVPGVRALGGQFLVNTLTTNVQSEPTIGIDGSGNFVIAWSSMAQDFSYFNSINAQRFDRDGNRIGAEFVVNEDMTTINMLPYVGVAQDGVFAIGWERTNDPNWTASQGQAYQTASFVKVYNSQGGVILDEFYVEVTGGGQTIAFDSADNFVVSWSLVRDKDHLLAANTNGVGVYAQEYQLYGVNGGANGQVIRPMFRVNSAEDGVNGARINLDSSRSFWPGEQREGQVGMDADGDITISFEGFGPDVSEIDVDRRIDSTLISAKAAGATDAELATLRAQLESYFGLLRGESYGAMYSQFDTDPTLFQPVIVSSDNVANGQRSGRNTRVLLDVNPAAVTGNFALKLTNPYDVVATTSQPLVVYYPNNGPVNPIDTMKAIHNALSALPNVGTNWVQNGGNYDNGPFGGPIAIRLVPASELAMRASTATEENPWDPALWGINTDHYVYEITFQGELHDSPVSLELVPGSNTLKLSGTKTAEVQQMIFSSLNGLPATGPFTFSIGNFTSGSIYFDSNNLAAVAAQVQGQLNVVYPGATVTALPGGPPWILQVTFGGNEAGVDQPLILVNTSGLNGVTYLPKEVIKGAAANASAGDPGVVTQTYGSYGTYHFSTSLGMTPSGNFVVTWCDATYQNDDTPSTMNFYFRDFKESTDTAGPQVTRWTAGDGTYVKQSEATNVVGGVRHVVVTFDEQMYDNAQHTGDAVTNPKNYKLYRDGVEVPGAIVSVQYGLNKASQLSGTAGYDDLDAVAANRWEAVVEIDGNGNVPGTPAMTDGVYTLVALAPVAVSESNPNGRSGLRDKSGNALGRTGYVPSGQDYTRSFTLLTSDTLPGGGTQTGTEILVNQTSTAAQYNQSISQTSAVAASEHNRRAVAMNHYGDFAVVWTSHGQDGSDDVSDPNFDPNHETAGGVYVRLISRNNVALTSDIRVNAYTKGEQIDGTVAMDADGDFVVVWESQGQDADGSWGIYGQRFNALGEKVGGEFQVNTFYTNDQVSPSVAMDSFGNFVVVWATKGQSFSYFNEVHGQAFDHEGNKIGSEFRVNSQTIPGSSTTPSANNLHPTVAMSDSGTFVVAWDVPTTQQNGVIYDSVIMARLFNRDGTPIAINGNNAEFQANVGSSDFIADPQHLATHRLDAISHRARNAQVAMDSAGNFLIVWEALQDNDTFTTPDSPDSYGIYFRRFAADGTPQMETDEQANFTVTALAPPPDPGYTLAQSAPFAGDQLNPSVAMDADGDYTIVWNGNGAMPDAANPTNLTLLTQADSNGVFIRSFHAFNDPQDTVVPEAVSVQSRANLTQAGDQKFPSVAMTPKGDRVVVWSGNGIQDSDGVFARRYAESSDTAGPIITNWFTPSGTIIDQDAEVTAIGGLQHVVVSFDEEMYDNATHTGDAVTNPANYRLLLNGVEVSGAIVKVDYGLNMASQFGASDVTMAAMNRWEAVVTISSGGTSGAVLTPGSYTIEALAPVAATTAKPNGKSGLRDKVGNPLGYSGFQTDGATASRNLTLVTGSSGGGSGYNTGVEFPINQTTANSQTLGAYRTVAADHSGDFAVVWTGYGAQDADGVYVRLFSRDNVALTDEILVNTTTTGSQTHATIAMDADGDFVVVWASQNAGNWDIYGQRFDSMGRKLGGEFRVNTSTTGDQVTPAVAMDSFGNFVVTWASGDGSFNYNNNIYAQAFDGNGNRISNEVRVNTENTTGFNGRPNTTVSNPVVAISDTGRFVVSWLDVTNQVNGVIIDGEIVARMFSLTGVPLAINGSADEFLVNVGTAGFLADAQHTPRVAHQPSPEGGLPVRNPEITMDRDGRFIIAWEAYQDNDAATVTAPGADSYGVYFRRFNADGTAVTAVDEQANLTATGGPSVFTGDQLHPSLAMTVNGQFTIVWDGSGGQPDTTTPMDASLVRSSDSAGVWQRSFLTMPTTVAAQEAVGVQTRVNTTQGDVQQYPSVAMTPAGSSIVAWSGKGYGDTDGIFARRFASTTNDTVGPMCTSFLLPDGSLAIDNVQVTQNVKAIIVTFDEDMFNAAFGETGWEHSVTNPNNYQLMRNGEVISAGINQVFYGLDAAHDLGSQYGLNVPKLNKYQAVLIVDANGASSGVLPLSDGQYQVVVLNALRDKANNPLASTGPGPNGARMSGVINITLPTGQETLVGGGYTSATTPSPIDGSLPIKPETSSAKTVASDADGDYVVVWTDTTAGHTGVWARLYKQVTTIAADGTRTTSSVSVPVKNPLTGQYWADDAILVSGDASASDVSVARDADGDFVVTWSTWNSTTSWDVWAQRYDATGKPAGAAFRANTYVNSVQRYSSVAMSAEGDFVIAWQSLDQDGSGYGVYAQRYDADGNALGGSDESQALKFTDGFTGTFKLRIDHDNNSLTPDKVTQDISYTGNAAACAAAVKNALAAIGIHAEVTASNSTTLVVHFVGTEASKNMAPLWISSTDVVKSGGSSDAKITTSTTSGGYSGEFRVNDTTAGDQYEPDVAMNAGGNFIITWTSAGQDGDNPGQTNVYAKRYLANDAYWSRSSLNSGGSSDAVPYDGAVFDTYYIAVDDPANHVVEPGQGYDGVVEVFATDSTGGTGLGTGALLVGGKYILTASHVIWDMNINAPMTAPNIEVVFHTPDGPVTCFVDAVFVNPQYDGNPFNGADVSLLRLADPAPAGVEQYDIYRGSNEMGQVTSKYGWGQIGQGNTGGTEEPDGMHTGQNKWEATGSLVGVSDVLLVYDFDDGTAQHDGFGQVYGIRDTGVGVNESSGYHGDSGGPSFLNGLIAGVCTGGVNIPGSHDVLAGLNGSFGDFGMDTRVSVYADWIDRVMQGGGAEFLVNCNDLLSPELASNNTAGNQGHSSVAMNAAGDFVITWTSYGMDGVGDGAGPGFNGQNGVFARSYTLNFDPSEDQRDNLFVSQSASGVFQVNDIAEENQQNSRVAMDADGDFVITWESEKQDGSGYGIYARRYARFVDVHYTMIFGSATPYLMIGQNPMLGPNGEMGGEIAVNVTKLGDQRFPGVAVDATGDAVIVWSGNGSLNANALTQQVFYQRFARPTDNAGPTVASIASVTTDNGATVINPIRAGESLGLGVKQLLLTFSEDISQQAGSSGSNSILNPANWQLTRNGKVLGGAIAKIQYGLDLAYQMGLVSAPTNKYEAVITVDSDPSVAGNQTLSVGDYVFTLKDSVQDLFGNRLDGDYSGVSGGHFTRTFSVGVVTGEDGPVLPPGDPASGTTDTVINVTTAGIQNDPAVATDAEGNYVVVWVSYDASGAVGDIKGQRFDKYGKARGSEFTVNSTVAGNQVWPDVAMDAFGNFVVTWSGPGVGDDSGVFARLYDSAGNAVGSEFVVNQFAQNLQNMPSVAMDDNGNFVVTWTSYGQDGDRDGVYARRFNVQGTPVSAEFRVNSTTQDRQDKSVVAMDSDGDFVIVWESWGQDASSDGQWGVFGQRFNASGARLGGEFQVNTYTLDKQMNPAVAMDSDGDFIVAWESMGQDGNGYGVYARRYRATGAAIDAAEFRANSTTANNQWRPDVGLADDGSFVVTWASLGQDNIDPSNSNPTHDYGVFARQFLANGAASPEYRVNATRIGDQTLPALSMTASGNYVIAWQGPNVSGAGTDLFDRVVRMTTSSAVTTNAGPTLSKMLVVEENAAARDGVLSTSDRLILTWNVADSDGVASTTIKIDGVVVAKVFGPYADPTGGANYAAVLGTLAAGNHTYTISATDKLGVATEISSSFTVVSAEPFNLNVDGPTIGGISTATGVAKPFISWNLVDADGISSTTIEIDGQRMPIFGPYTATNGGSNYSCSIASLAAGTHAYTIRATDKAGKESVASATFTVPDKATSTNAGPTIGGVSTATGVPTPFISWNLLDADGISSTTIEIDGQRMPIFGPYTATNGGSNYSCSIASLAAGTHSYTIKATDKAGMENVFSSTFAVPAKDVTSASAPVISRVVASTTGAQRVVTWNVVDGDGIASTSIRIGEKTLTGIFGPYQDANGGSNYGASLNGLAAGTYSLEITAKDKLGTSKTYNDSITIPGATGDTAAPSVNNVVVVTQGVSPVISWNLLDADGIASTTITIDNKRWTKQFGPYVAKNGGSNYSADLQGLSAGTHSFVISATDKTGRTTQKTGTFTMPSATSVNQAVFSSFGASTETAKVQWLYGG